MDSSLAADYLNIKKEYEHYGKTDHAEYIKICTRLKKEGYLDDRNQPVNPGRDEENS
jgi:hypothetical protein